MKYRAYVVFAVTVVAFALAEYWLYRSYIHHDANFHWFTHFFVGTSIALLAMSLYSWLRRRPVRFWPVWLLAAHVFAMIPDVLFRASKLAHQQWMDVFFGHITTHFVVGGNVTWYVVFLGSLAVYLYVLYRISLDNHQS